MPALKQLAPNLYVGELPFRLAGAEIGSRMTVVKLPQGVLVYSPIELEPFREEVEALGSVRYLVAPNKFHYLHLREWLQAYPESEVYAAPGVKPRAGIGIHHFLEDEPVTVWSPHLEHALFKGSKAMVEAVFFHPESRTLVLTDTAVDIPATRDGYTRVVSGALGVLEHFSPTRYLKFSMQDKEAVRASLNTILSWDFDRVIIAHGKIHETGGKEALRKAYEFALE